MSTNTGHNSLNSMLRVLHDVGDKENKIYDIGTIIGYLKVPKRAYKAKNKCIFLL